MANKEIIIFGLFFLLMFSLSVNAFIFDNEYFIFIDDSNTIDWNGFDWNARWLNSNNLCVGNDCITAWADVNAAAAAGTDTNVWTEGWLADDNSLVNDWNGNENALLDFNTGYFNGSIYLDYDDSGTFLSDGNIYFGNNGAHFSYDLENDILNLEESPLHVDFLETEGGIYMNVGNEGEATCSDGSVSIYFCDGGSQVGQSISWQDFASRVYITSGLLSGGDINATNNLRSLDDTLCDSSVCYNIADFNNHLSGTDVNNWFNESTYGSADFNSEYKTNISGGSSFELFFWDLPSGITDYNIMDSNSMYGAVKTHTIAIEGDAQNLIEFYYPHDDLNRVDDGTSECSLHAYKSAGTKEAQIYCELYERDAGGNESLLWTTETSSDLSGSDSHVEVHATHDQLIFDGNFLVLKILGNETGAGTDPVVVLSIQGTTGSHVGLPVATIVEHNNMREKQGGSDADNEFYHITQDEHQLVSDWNNAVNNAVTASTDTNIFTADIMDEDNNNFLIDMNGSGEQMKFNNALTVAIGKNASATGQHSVALSHSNVTGEYSFGFGFDTQVSNGFSVGLGRDCDVNTTESACVGAYNNIGGVRATAVGSSSTANGLWSTVVGTWSMATANYSTAVGNFANAVGGKSLAVGYDVNAYSSGSTAIGYQSSAGDKNATAIGWGAVSNEPEQATIAMDVNIGRDLNVTRDFRVKGKRITFENDNTGDRSQIDFNGTLRFKSYDDVVFGTYLFLEREAKDKDLMFQFEDTTGLRDLTWYVGLPNLQASDYNTFSFYASGAEAVENTVFKMDANTGLSTFNYDVNVTGDLNVTGTIYNDNECGIDGGILQFERTTVASNSPFAVGNGSNTQGLAQACSGTATAISAQCVTANGSNHASYEVRLNGASQVCDTAEVNSANTGFSTTGCDVKFSQNDIIGCYSNTETGATSSCTCAIYVRYD